MSIQCRKIIFSDFEKKNNEVFRHRIDIGLALKNVDSALDVERRQN